MHTQIHITYSCNRHTTMKQAAAKTSGIQRALHTCKIHTIKMSDDGTRNVHRMKIQVSENLALCEKHIREYIYFLTEFT